MLIHKRKRCKKNYDRLYQKMKWKKKKEKKSHVLLDYDYVTDKLPASVCIYTFSVYITHNDWMYVGERGNPSSPSICKLYTHFVIYQYKYINEPCTYFSIPVCQYTNDVDKCLFTAGCGNNNVLKCYFIRIWTLTRSRPHRYVYISIDICIFIFWQNIAFIK